MSNVKRVSPAEAKELVDNQGYTYVDVRSEPEYAAGHPTAAHNVPFMHSGPGGMTPNPEFMDVMAALYAKDQKLILGCRSGGRSLRAAEALIAAGYTNIIDQRAGYEGPRNAFGAIVEQGWATAGLPTESETAGGSYAELRKKAGKG